MQQRFAGISSTRLRRTRHRRTGKKRPPGLEHARLRGLPHPTGVPFESRQGAEQAGPLMISHARFLVAAICLLVAACDQNYGVGFDYRVASKDPKVGSAQMLRVVTDTLD